MPTRTEAFGATAAPLLKSSNFSWKNIGQVLAACGLILSGIPEEVLFPGEKRNETATRFKGLADIGSRALKAFVDAIFDRNSPHPIRLTRYHGPQSGAFALRRLPLPTTC